MAARERPIPLKAHEVRGILEGRQSQVRRVVKDIIWDAYEGPYRMRLTPEDHKGDDVRDDFHDGRIRCPYGEPGDRLWVREAWRTEIRNDYIAPRDLRPQSAVYYEAGGGGEEEIPACAGKLRPSIHMPRWASRIDLEVIGVRVERLQDISDEDCWAEAPPGLSYPIRSPSDFAVTEGGRQRCYQRLWESINGPGSWDANPWVWVVEFKRIRL